MSFRFVAINRNRIFKNTDKGYKFSVKNSGLFFTDNDRKVKSDTRPLICS